MSLRPISKDSKGKRKREIPFEAKNVNMVNLDPNDDISPATLTQMPWSRQKKMKDLMCPQPEGESKSIRIGKDEDRTIKISCNLTVNLEQMLIQLLQDNKDLFAWTATYMPGIDPDFCCHHLNIYPGTKPVAQKKRKMRLEK